MKTLLLLLVTACLLPFGGCVQNTPEPRWTHDPLTAGAPRSIEGYWQDAERRVLFSRAAPASASYGKWARLDPGQTYPLAKHVRRSGPGYELIDLNYDSSYAIEVLNADESRIEFDRAPAWAACRMHHDCRLEGAGLFCALENRCQEGSVEVLDWRGEERYVRRWFCQRVGRAEAQGIPVRCE